MSSTAGGAMPGIGSAVSITSLFLLVVSALAILTRLATKWSVEGVLNLDDAFAVGALVTSIGSTVAVHYEVVNGLATPRSQLDADQITNFTQSLYATGLLYIITLCLAKLSIIALMNKISPNAMHRKIGRGVAVTIAIGSFILLIAAAFQCAPPQTWRVGSKCYDRVAFWSFAGAYQILVDIALIAFPLHIIIPLQIRLKWKILVLTSFAARILDIAATSVQLGFTSGFASSDFTMDTWQWTFLAQLAQCISIVTSCVPYLRPLLEALPSGLMLSEDPTQRSTRASAARNYYGSSRSRSRKPIPSMRVTRNVSRGFADKSELEGAAVFAPADSSAELQTARDRFEMEAQGERRDDVRIEIPGRAM